jgi:hypothetical protein
MSKEKMSKNRGATYCYTHTSHTAYIFRHFFFRHFYLSIFSILVEKAEKENVERGKCRKKVKEENIERGKCRNKKS